LHRQFKGLGGFIKSPLVSQYIPKVFSNGCFLRRRLEAVFQNLNSYVGSRLGIKKLIHSKSDYWNRTNQLTLKLVAVFDFQRPVADTVGVVANSLWQRDVNVTIANGAIRQDVLRLDDEKTVLLR
jgi:hypothetical protein